MLKGQHNVAVVCARGLGDALLSMILAHNLKLSGKNVTVFSSILCELQEWFPTQKILPYPSSDNFCSTYGAFDSVIAADHSQVKDTHHLENQVVILKEKEFDKAKTMVENLQNICTTKFNLPFGFSTNGMTPIPGLQWKKYKKRVLLHPMSSDEKKNWPAEKFLALAKALEKEGYQPFFCVSPAEAVMWKALVPAERLPSFPSVSDLAAFIFESAGFIGNDSGVGHLASLLNISTLSLFARKSYSFLWRPGWAAGAVVCPPNILFGSRMKQKYWKSLLSVKRVHRAFKRFTQTT